MSYPGKFIEIDHQSHTTLRDPTPEELHASTQLWTQITKARREMNEAAERYLALVSMCPHTVRYDEPGFIYDDRICAACGASMGLV